MTDAPILTEYEITLLEYANGNPEPWEELRDASRKKLVQAGYLVLLTGYLVLLNGPQRAQITEAGKAFLRTIPVNRSTAESLAHALKFPATPHTPYMDGQLGMCGSSFAGRPLE